MSRPCVAGHEIKILLTGLEVLEEDIHSLGLLTKVLDDDTGAANDLAGVAVAINLAETSPLSELLGIRNLDQVDVVLGAESLDELDVFLLSAGLDEDSHVCLASVQRGKIEGVNITTTLIDL